MEVTVSEIKIVSSVLFVVGAALSWGEVRIQRGEDHREKYEAKIVIIEGNVNENQINIAEMTGVNKTRLAFNNDG